MTGAGAGADGGEEHGERGRVVEAPARISGVGPRLGALRPEAVSAQATPPFWLVVSGSFSESLLANDSAEEQWEESLESHKQRLGAISRPFSQRNHGHFQSDFGAIIR